MTISTGKRIRVHIPAPIESPLFDMLELIPASMSNIAPERRDELLDVLQGVTIVLTGEPKWVASHTPATREIQLSVRVLELLWCASYAYTVLVNEVYVKRDHTDFSPIDLTPIPVVRDAMTLLQWALNEWIDGAGATFPEGLFPNRLPRLEGSYAAIADDLALCAVAFILHHELAHDRLRHQPASGDHAWGIEQENEADAAAADWILERLSVASPFFFKRMVGAAIATLAMTARGVHSNSHGGKTHPRHFDRLVNLLERFVADEPHHDAWTFAVVALKLHLDNSRIDVPVRMFDSARACLMAYVDAIAEAAEI